jgi:hypothetical protein
LESTTRRGRDIGDIWNDYHFQIPYSDHSSETRNMPECSYLTRCGTCSGQGFYKCSTCSGKRMNGYETSLNLLQNHMIHSKTIIDRKFVTTVEVLAFFNAPVVIVEVDFFIRLDCVLNGIHVHRNGIVKILFCQKEK